MCVSRLYPPKHLPVYFWDTEFCASPLFFSQNTTLMPLWMQTGAEWNQVFWNAFTSSDKGDSWRCTIPPIFLIPLSISTISFNLIFLKYIPWNRIAHPTGVWGFKASGVPLYQLNILRCMWDRISSFHHHSTWSTEGFQETTWLYKEQRQDTLPLRPPLEDKLFPPLSSLTHK